MSNLIGIRSLCVVALATMLLAPVSALGQSAAAPGADGQVVVEYSFARPEVAGVTIAGQQYDRVLMPNVPNCGNPGEPALPASGARILLPYGTDVSNIEIVTGKAVSLGSGYVIEPVEQPVKLSADPAEIVPPTPNAAVYALNQAFPAEQFEQIGTSGFRGYQILTLKLQPMQYNPTTGELSYFPKLTVVVSTVDSGRDSAMLRCLAKDQQAVVAKVDNPQTVSSYPATVERTDRGYDLLIVTTDALSSSFQPLKAYHDARGIATEIVTTATIGGSDCDSVRNYIASEYAANGIEYVIIGADDNIIPAPNLYVEAWSGGDVETEMPGDVFFSCLDGTWNNDGDSYWGERTDGNGGGDVDLVSEIYVGRASVDNASEAARFVNKTIWYCNRNHTHAQKLLLVGEYLGFGGISDYAAPMMEQLIDGCSEDGYTTAGLPLDSFIVDELFERDGSWSQSTLRNRVNAGIHFLNHLGHGSPDYAMKFYNSDVSSFSNTELCFVYSQTCLAGHFDGTDCWAECMHIKTDYGAFAVIMNARYGWGSGYSTDGPNQRFNREFWDAVYGEGLTEYSRANQDSKEDNLYRINESCMRWCYYEINLFGDPTMAIQGTTRLSFSYPNGLPETLLPGEPTVIEVEITGIGENVVSGSPSAFYRYDGGNYQSVSMTHVSGNLYEATLPPANCGDTPELYFGALGDISGPRYDPIEAPATIYTMPVGEMVTAIADDFETDQGWVAENLGASSGDWERGVPVNDYSWIYDPVSDSDGSGKCYLTENQNGNTDIDDGAVRLTSPTLDMSGGNVTISYDYFLYLTNDNGTDMLLVEIDNGSGNWIEIARHDTDGGLSWRSHVIEQSDLDAAGVTLTSTMRVRFTANDDGVQSISEAGLDAFRVTSLTCDAQEYALTVIASGSGSVTKDPDQATYADGTTVELTAVADPGWAFDHWEGDLNGSTNPETLYMDGPKSVTAVFVEDQVCPGDLDDDGDVDLSDLQILLSNYGETSVPYESGDMDDDGDVDLADLQLLLSVYGSTC